MSKPHMSLVRHQLKWRVWRNWLFRGLTVKKKREKKAITWYRCVAEIYYNDKPHSSTSHRCSLLIISIFLRLRPVTRPNSNIHTCTSSSINSKCSLGFAGTKTDSDKAGMPVTECKMKLSCENIQKHDKNTEYPAGTACPLAFFMKLMY